MNRDARKVMNRVRKLDRPPIRIEVSVETSDGFGRGYGGDPSTEVNYEICARDGTHVSGSLKYIDGNWEDSREEGISIAKDIAEEVFQSYSPRGYEKTFNENKQRISRGPLVDQIYSTDMWLQSKKKK